MKDSVIAMLSMNFAIRTVRFYKFLTEEKRVFIISKQLLRSGTSIGANVREAEFAQSRADFISKMSIALKEAGETRYWIELLYKSEIIEHKVYESLLCDIRQIIGTLVKIVSNRKDAKSDEKHILVGLDYYEHKPIEIFLDEARSIAIYGKKKFGKTNLVNRIVRTIRQFHRDYRFVFFDDGRKQLEGIWQEAPAGDNNVYITTVDELTDFLDSNGYAAKMMRGVVNKDFKEQKTPFTVFVLQNKMLFQSVGAQLLKGTFPKMIANAEEKGYIFIYSDVRKISNNDRDTESSLNNTFSVAFLLDNIAEFVGDRGSRSVFGEMDAKELKNEYAHCELGDGYFYDIESDELKKLKFIKNKQ